MAYFTAAGLIAFGGERAVLQLLDPDSTGTPDTGLVATLQVRTKAILDGYIGRNYSIATVVASVAAGGLPLIELLACSVAMHLAYLAKPEFVVDGKTPAQGGYDMAMSMLKQIGKGEIRLDVDSDPEKPANVRAGGVRTGTYSNTPIGPGFIKDGTGGGGY